MNWTATHYKLFVAAFKTVLAPLVAGVALAVIAYQVVTHFEALTGASPALAIGLPILVPIADVLGALVAYQMKQSGSARFAQLGAHRD